MEKMKAIMGVLMQTCVNVSAHLTGQNPVDITFVTSSPMFEDAIVASTVLTSMVIALFPAVQSAYKILRGRKPLCSADRMFARSCCGEFAVAIQLVLWGRLGVRMEHLIMALFLASVAKNCSYLETKTFAGSRVMTNSLSYKFLSAVFSGLSALLYFFGIHVWVVFITGLLELLNVKIPAVATVRVKEEK